MITLTCREIIRAAQFIAGVRNSNISNFEFTTSILNNIYRELYQKIIDNSDAYISTISGKSTPDGIALPEDCYQVEAVYIGTDWEHKREIHRSARNQDIDGCWRIINNRLYVDGNMDRPIIIKYSTLPPTLTAPDDPIKLNNFGSPTVVYPYSDNEVYEVDGGQGYIYNLDNQTRTVGAYSYQEKWMSDDTYYNVVVDYANQKIYVNSVDMTAEFIDSSRGTFTAVHFDYPHWVVTYQNGTITIDGSVWNVFEDTGHPTKGIALALKTSDRTGQYVIYQDEKGVYYQCSFVPDTVISYPDNSFFQLLEYKVAQFLAGQVGTANATLEDTLLPNAEKQFYDSLSKNGNIVRTNNVYRKY